MHNEEEDSIKEMFKNFKNTKTNKYISLEDYIEVINELNDKTHSMSYQNALNAFYEIDSNKNGIVTYKDFTDLMRFKLFS